jgi:hypothetical protein
MLNGNSSYGNGASICLAAADDPKVKSLPWLFRVLIPGYEGGWPAR